MNNILFIHLFNNYSGSPKVLSGVIDSCILRGRYYHLLTSKTDGFLNNYKSSTFKYTIGHSRILNLFWYLYAQVYIFIYVIFLSRKFDVVYVNTILPFSAAVAAKIMGVRVVYHIHEVDVSPPLLSKFLKLVLRKTGNDFIFVSNYLRRQYSFIKSNAIIIYNFVDISREYNSKLSSPSVSRKILNISLVSSCRKYKGVDIFFELSRLFLDRKEYKFNFYCSDGQKFFENYIKGRKLPSNITVHFGINDNQNIYMNTDLLLNLTLEKLCIETFGLTIVEAMSFGIPSIVPLVGGPAEIVRHSIDGYHCDSSNIIEVSKAIDMIFTNDNYHNLSECCYERANEFSFSKFSHLINKVIMGEQ